MPTGSPGKARIGNGKIYRRRHDEFKLEICDFIYNLIAKEPDLAGFDFGFAKSGSEAYITIRDPDKGMRTLHIMVKDTWDKKTNKAASQSGKGLTGLRDCSTPSEEL